MNAFPKIDMGEVTRLTRAGKLAEAMALLKGGAASRAARDSARSDGSASTERIALPPPTIDRAAPPIAADAGRAARAAALPRLAHTMRAYRHRLPGPRSLSRPGEGAGSVSVAVPEGARFEERAFSNDAGSRTYKVYAPSGYSGQSLPVVVMLHGCTQNPDDFAAGTRMNEVAEEQTFLVAYPRQPRSANMRKCWNWFNAADQQREGGEPSLIAGIALQVVEEFSADPSRVYVAGLSAGGAAAAILAATHPDIFAAVGVHSGLARGAASDMASAFAAMGGSATPRPIAAGATVPTIVFHGDADRTVHSINGDHVVAQATQDSQARQNSALTPMVTRGETSAGMAYTRTVQRDAAGRQVIEQWVLHGAGHAWSGGGEGGSYTDARGPDASREMIRFFLGHANAKAPPEA